MNLDHTTIVVTGGCGLIGSTTIDLLLREHNVRRIIVLDNLSRGSLANLADALGDPRVSLVEGDIRDRDTVSHVISGADAVLHMAAIRITACATEPREAMEVMCNGSFNVVEAAQTAGVRKIVAASSASIYGLAEQFPTPESHHPYGNRTWYGAAKMMLEGLLRSFNEMHGLPYVALRYFNVYGPRMDIHGKYTEVLIRWMERLEECQRPIIMGDGMQTMDMIHVEDVARANVLALASDVSDEVFNVGSGVETSLLGLAQTLARVMGRSAEMEYAPERKVNGLRRRVADITHAESRLGFRARVPLEEGLKELVAWWRVERAIV
jgi:UDP-glucose 4-epimerase